MSKARNLAELVTDMNGVSKPLTSLSKNKLVVYDDFDSSDQILNGRTSITKQVWSVSGPGANIASITDGVFQANGCNCYASLQYGENIEYISGVFSYVRGSGTTSSSSPQAVLIAQDESLDLGTMLHAQFFTYGWSIQYRNAGGSFDNIGGGAYKLAQDGTPYRCGMHIVDDTVTVELPTGEEVVITDSRISAMVLKAGTWQIQGSVTTTPQDNFYEPRWHGVYIGGKAQGKPVILNGAAPSGEVRRLGGLGFGERDSASHVITANGTYRIAVNSTIGGYSIYGKLKIDVQGLTLSRWEANVAAVGGQDPVAYVDYDNSWLSYHVASVRLGTNTTGAYVDVVLQNVSTPIIMNVNSEGFVILPKTPVLNPTTPAKIATYINPAVGKVTKTYTYGTTGWTRLSSETGGPGGYINTGILSIKAYDAGRICMFDLPVQLAPSTALTKPQIINCAGGTSPISKVRYSRESGKVAIDVYCAYAGTNVVTIEATYDGWFTPPATLVAATALTTESLESNFTAGFESERRLVIQPDADDTFTVVTLSSGATYAMTDYETHVHHNGTTLTSLTVTVPPNPKHGQTAQFSATNGVTTLTFNGATYTAASGIPIRLKFNVTTGTWLRC